MDVAVREFRYQLIVGVWLDVLEETVAKVMPVGNKREPAVSHIEVDRMLLFSLQRWVATLIGVAVVVLCC